MGKMRVLSGYATLLLVLAPSFTHSSIMFQFGGAFVADNGLFQAINNTLSASGTAQYNSMIAAGTPAADIVYTAPSKAAYGLDASARVYPWNDNGFYFNMDILMAGSYWNIKSSWLLGDHELSLEYDTWSGDFGVGYEFKLPYNYSFSLGGGINYSEIRVLNKTTYNDTTFNEFNLADGSSNPITNMIGASATAELSCDYSIFRLTLYTKYSYIFDTGSSFQWSLFSAGIKTGIKI